MNFESSFVKIICKVLKNSILKFRLLLLRLITKPDSILQFYVSNHYTPKFHPFTGGGCNFIEIKSIIFITFDV